MDEFKFNFNDIFFYENNRTLANLEEYSMLKLNTKTGSQSNNLYDNGSPNHRTPANTNSINFYLISMVGMFMIGLITNTFNLILLTRKPMKSITNRYLCALALCDLFVLFFSLLSLSNSFINTETAAILSLLNTFINENSDDIDNLIESTSSYVNSIKSNDDFNNISNTSSVSGLIKLTTPIHSLIPSSSLNDLINSTSDDILSDSLLLLKEDIAETNLFKAVLKLWSSKIFPRIYPFTYPLGKNLCFISTVHYLK